MPIGSTQSSLCAARSSTRHRAAVLLRAGARSSRRVRRDRTPRPCVSAMRFERPRLRPGSETSRPACGARPLGMKASAKPGWSLSSATCVCPLPRDGRRDQEAVARRSRIAGSNRSANGSLPKRVDRSTQRRDRARHGDRVPAAQRHRRRAREAVGRPAGGRASRGVQAVQLLAVPHDARRRRSRCRCGRLDAPSARSRWRAPRRPRCRLCSSMRRPACAASGCEVATTLRASTGMRCEA